MIINGVHCVSICEVGRTGEGTTSHPWSSVLVLTFFQGI